MEVEIVMEIQEWSAKKVLKSYGVNVLEGVPVPSADKISSAVDELIKKTGSDVVVVKAQVLAGGRGKAGGIKVAKSKEEAIEAAKKMLGMTLHTHQTGAAGKVVHKLYLEQGCKIVKEYYLSLIANRETSKVTIMASTEGGMDIEEVAAHNPEKIVYVDVDVNYGLQAFHSRLVCYGLALDKTLHTPMSSMIQKLYNTFVATDAMQIEINPLALIEGNEFIALDAKMNFDDNALFRQKNIEAMRDHDEEEVGEREAREAGLSYVKMDGSIGCMVNGAGLAMATMDIIKYFGEEPANFLDVGGGADQARVEAAFRIILKDPNIKGILINIFGGIVKCDMIARGIIEATRNIGFKVPVVARLVGTNFEEGKRLLKESGLNIVAAEGLEEAAKKIVELVKKHK